MLHQTRWISDRTSDKPLFKKIRTSRVCMVQSNWVVLLMFCWMLMDMCLPEFDAYQGAIALSCNLELLHLDKHQTQVSTCPSASNGTSVRPLSCFLSYVFYICFEDEPTDKYKLWKLKSKMSIISLSLFNEWAAYIHFKFPVLCNNI